MTQIHLEGMSDSNFQQGSSWEMYRAYIEDHAVKVTMNHQGSFYNWNG